MSVQVTLTMENGRKYVFSPHADTMLYIKSRVSPSMIRYEMEGSVEEYIDRHIRDPIEADKLRQVFAEACPMKTGCRPKSDTLFFAYSPSMMRMISRSVSLMPSRANRPMLRMVFSTPLVTMPSPP